MIETAPFGRTGHQSSRLIFGAAGLGGMNQARADQLLETVRTAGINHIDTAAGYGESESRLRPFLAHYRSEFFLATKTAERSGSGARRSLEASLIRLGVDSVDLIQLHQLIEPDDWEQAHGPDGAVEAMVAARKEGLVRFIGVTGHGTRSARQHLSSLDRFDFDSVLLPYNYLMTRDDDYRVAFDELADRCAERGVAMQTIKSVARRRWLDDAPERKFAWYQPLATGPALDRAVGYVLSRPQLFLNTSSDATLLASIIAAAGANRITPTDDELASDVEALDMVPLFDGGVLDTI
ncbi:MAG: aldo/keto reductase [Actinomycetes bacterium]